MAAAKADPIQINNLRRLVSNSGGLLKKPDDLFVRESALPHGRSFLRKRTLLTFDWYALWGSGQPEKRIDLESVACATKVPLERSARDAMYPALPSIGNRLDFDPTTGSGDVERTSSAPPNHLAHDSWIEHPPPSTLSKGVKHVVMAVSILIVESKSAITAPNRSGVFQNFLDCARIPDVEHQPRAFADFAVCPF